MPIPLTTTFKGKEESDTLEIAYLYVIQAEGNTFYLTSNDAPVTYLNYDGSDRVFFPAIISHGAFERKARMEDSEIDINIGVTEEVLPQIVYRVSFQDVTVKVIRSHLFYDANEQAETDSDNSLEEAFSTIYTYTEESDMLRLSGRISLFQGNNEIPRFFYQKTCNHDFGGKACGVNIDAHKVSGTIHGIDANQQLLYVGAGTTANKFQGGYVLHTATGFKIGIRAQSTSGSLLALYLFNWIPEFYDFNTSPNEQVVVYPGCLKTVAFCDSTYGNKPNFGGFPFMPLRNPISSGI